MNMKNMCEKSAHKKVFLEKKTTTNPRKITACGLACDCKSFFMLAILLESLCDLS